MRWRYVVLGGLFALLALGGTAAAALPGPQRALCPQCYGLTDIGGNLFTDAPERAVELTSMIVRAREKVAAFFGSAPGARPRIILCTTLACDRDFGGGGKAKGNTIGAVLVRIGPLLMTDTILAHELLHAEVAALWLARGWTAGPALPAWFNEGLAVLVSGDERYPGGASADEIAAIKGAVSPGDWLRAAGRSDISYNAAYSAVAAIEAEVGSDGLRAIVAATELGVPFADALKAVGLP